MNVVTVFRFLLVTIPFASLYSQSFSLSSSSLSSAPKTSKKLRQFFAGASTLITMPSDDDFEPQPKKAKNVKEEESDKDEEAEDDDGDEESGAVKRNADGEAYFDLGKAKRVTVRQWKTAVLVDIREFYEKGGKELPGKKGISLTLEQYKELRKHIMDGSLDKQVEELKKGK
ncbi:hypothetical protein HJC23_001172 [Cyclotella cryptica]|uniref:Transcriptional coactivator p15 (PC4) C-terminal domain-containing protein n=1 Tax=Cyclotella cryptica TaxID=29204 RepID=A0ABD3QRT5_9STRA